MDVKKIALAFLLLPLTTLSHADWNPNDELVLTVWNPVTKTSFTQELNVKTSDALYLASSSFSLDPGGLAHVGGADAEGLQWNVSGFNEEIGTPLGDTLYLTGNAIVYGGHTTALTSSLYNFQAYKYTLETKGTLSSTADGITDTVLLSGDYYAGYGGTWGDSMYGIRNLSYIRTGTSAGNGDSMYAYNLSIGVDLDAGRLTYPVNQSPGIWTLDAGNGQLTYSAVPLPAGLWLFLTGIAGLVKFSRIKKQS